MSNLALGKVTQTKKNHIHVKKVGHTSEFTFGIYWWTLKNPIIRILKKWKKVLEISSFYKCVPKTTITWGTVFEDGVRHNFLSFWEMFCSFTPLTTQKSKFWKSEVSICRYHHFTLVQQKTWYLCLLRYGVQQAWLFDILGHFLLFYPTIYPEN